MREPRTILSRRELFSRLLRVPRAAAASAAREIPPVDAPSVEQDNTVRVLREMEHLRGLAEEP